MSRVPALVLGFALSLLASTAVVHAESATIRIEPRPYHGAVVTIEQGVRVWRPLPPPRYVIINPNGQTPLSLGLTDIRERSTSHNYFYGNGGRGDVTVGGGAAGWPVVGGREHRSRHHGHHGRGSGFNGQVRQR